MQGAFNVDWDNVLDDTGLDEETTRLYRQKTDELEIARHNAAARQPRGRGRGHRGRGRGAPAPRGRGRGGLVGRDGAEHGPTVADGPANRQPPPSSRAKARLGIDRDEDDESEEGSDDLDPHESDEEDSVDDDDDEHGMDDADDPAVPVPPAPPPGPPAPAPAAGARVAEVVTRIPKPHPPAQSFRLGPKQFYVVPGADAPRAGLFGHYLTPYTIDRDECVPFPSPEWYDPNQPRVYQGVFIDAGWPGQPWPSKELVRAVQPFWQAEAADWIPNSVTDASAAWSAGLLQTYRDAARAIGRANARGPFMIERAVYAAVRDTNERGTVFNIGPPGHPDPSLPPNPGACRPGVDFVACPSPLDSPKYYEVGSDYLKRALEDGEALDFEFAKRMQGLLGVAQDAVWACLDPNFNPADRAGALERFSAGYTATFYKTVAWQDQQDPRAVATEALQQHKAFCEEWVHKHYRTLTPLVTAAAEALVADFYQSVRPRMKEEWALDVQQYARLLMRHPTLSQYFALCLQSYMTSLDQARPGRNSSYKVMNTATMLRFQSFKRFVKELESRASELARLYEEFEGLRGFHFHPYLVDWYSIAGQLPEAHRFFARPQDNMLLKRLRNPQGAGRAPWLVGRE